MLASAPGDAPSAPGDSGGRLRSGLVVAAAELVLYVGLAVWSTWPLATQLGTALPTGTEQVATVPLFNLWTMMWNADRVRHGLAGYWDAPIFHPARETFACSEPQPPQLLLAPLQTAARPALAYNVYLMLALALNGWTASRLLRAWGCGGLTAWLGGAAVELLPFVHWQLGVLQLVPLFPALLAMRFATHLGRRGTLAGGLWLGSALGGALGLAYLTSSNLGLFFITVLAVSAPALVMGRLFDWRLYAALAVGAGVCAVLIAPVVWVQLHVTKSRQFDRGLDTMTALSARAGDYTLTPWPQLLRLGDFSTDDRRPYWFLGPGAVKLLLAGVGVIGLARRGFRRTTLFLMLFGAVAFGLSLGPEHSPGEDASLSGWRQAQEQWPRVWAAAYRLLVAYVPGYAQVRNAFRFALLAQLAVALLAALALDHLRAWLFEPVLQWGVHRAALQTRMGQLAAAGLVLAMGGAAALEVRPPRQPVYQVPLTAAAPDWATWLKNDAPDGAVIVHLPIPQLGSVEAYLPTAEAMYWGLYHRRPMVNGYSGYFPERYIELQAKLPRFPDHQSLAALLESGVTHCVVHRSAFAPHRVFLDPQFRDLVRHVVSDEAAKTDIYEIAEPRGAESSDAEPPDV